ncbi:MAG: hypothetical protein K2I07_01820 [Lachnospiraceae bacterium]|nr:hypothetical protein [Lachnospiraceae bacterium]
MEIILTDNTIIAVNSIRPTADGLTIDVTSEKVADIEPQITPESVDTITCAEGDTVFARYCNQQLESISKDDKGVHIKTRYKTLTADKDVSKQLSELQNTILSMRSDLETVQNVQDVQNIAIAEVAEIVSQSIAEDGTEEGGTQK